MITGDLADLGEPDAYERLRGAARAGRRRAWAPQIIWVMGNHDERAAVLGRVLFGGETDADAPQDRVYDVDGLRIIALDIYRARLPPRRADRRAADWLADVLADPGRRTARCSRCTTRRIPTPIEIMAILELQEQRRLADVIRGTDVRGILAGHLHYSTHGTFAGIPVSVASATCYTIDISAPAEQPARRRRRPVDQPGAPLRRTRVVHSIVPIGDVAAGRRVLGRRARRARRDDARGAPRGVLEQDLDVQRGGGGGLARNGDHCRMELRAAIEGFARHLAVDRGFSEHTVRAYRGDLERPGARSPKLHAAPSRRHRRARTRPRDCCATGCGVASQRRARQVDASARHAPPRAASPGGWSPPASAPRMPAARLKAPRPDQHLPRVLTAAADRRHLRGPAGPRRTAGDPVAVRDLAIVELLYASRDAGERARPGSASATSTARG